MQPFTYATNVPLFHLFTDGPSVSPLKGQAHRAVSEPTRPIYRSIVSFNIYKLRATTERIPQVRTRTNRLLLQTESPSFLRPRLEQFSRCTFGVAPPEGHDFEAWFPTLLRNKSSQAPGVSLN